MRGAHPGDWWNSIEAMTWTRVPRETRWGRPVFVHAFEPEREGQTRAISAFVSVVGLLRMIGKHRDTEIANAVANALFTAQIESDLPTDEIAQRMTAPQQAGMGELRATYTDRLAKYFTENPMSLGGVRIPVLPPGTQLKMNNAPRPTAAFAQFETAFLRAVAAPLGLTYEQLSQDWSQTNYSSARASLNEMWRTTRRLQAVFAEQFMQPIYLAFLEEAFDRGFVAAPEGAPDFWDMPEAWSACRWIGPGRGYIDPVKEAQAAALRMESLTSNLEIELADQGIDFDDQMDQLEFENEELALHKLQRQSIADAAATSKVKPDSPEVEQGGNSGSVSTGNSNQ